MHCWGCAGPSHLRRMSRGHATAAFGPSECEFDEDRDVNIDITADDDIFMGKMDDGDRNSKDVRTHA